MSDYRIISRLNIHGNEEYYIEERVKCFFKYKWVLLDIKKYSQLWGFSFYHPTLKEAETILKLYIEQKTKIENFKPEIHEYNPGDL